MIGKTGLKGRGVFARRKRKKKLTRPQLAALYDMRDKGPRPYKGRVRHIHDILIKSGLAQLVYVPDEIGVKVDLCADLTDEGCRKIGVKVEVPDVEHVKVQVRDGAVYDDVKKPSTVIPIQQLRAAYAALLAEDDPMSDKASVQWLKLTRRWVPTLLDEAEKAERFRLAGSLPVSDGVASKLEEIRAEVEAAYKDKIAALEAECAAISVELGLPPTIRPADGEIRRMVDDYAAARQRIAELEAASETNLGDLLKTNQLEDELAELDERLELARSEAADWTSRFRQAESEAADWSARAKTWQDRAEKAEYWVVRARCGCTGADCRIHGSYDPRDVEGVRALLQQSPPRPRYDATTATPERLFRCGDCGGDVAMCPPDRAVRTFTDRDGLLRTEVIPENVPIPKCVQCGTVYFDPENARRIDEACRAAYATKTSMPYHGMLADMTEHESSIWYGVFGNAFLAEMNDPRFGLCLATLRANTVIEQLRRTVADAPVSKS